MRQLLLVSTAISLVLNSAALAADVTPAAIRAAPVRYLAPWAGVYIGAFAGGHWSTDRWTSDETNPADLGAFDLDVNGFTGGFISGANLQHGNIVWGVETDIGFFTGKKTFGPLRTLFPGNADIDSMETKFRYNAHARLRFGYSFGSWMPFIAAGAAYANTRATLVDTQEPPPTSEKLKQDRFGYTIGGGIDWMFAPNWIARIEYLHDRYLTDAFALASVQVDSQYFELTSNTVRGAVLYKFMPGTPHPAPGGIFKAPVAAHAQPWAGVYIGAFAGGHWSTDRWTSDETGPTENGPLEIKVDGFTGGGLIGANVQYGNYVWGVEADIGALAGSGAQDALRARFPNNALDSIQTQLRWNAHARIRTGYSFGSWMPFMATGVAFANTRMTLVDTTNTTRPISGSIDLNRVGFSAGGGVDWMFTPNWIARVEYIHDRYATASFAVPVQADSQHMSLRSHIVRGAVMYRLGEGAAAPAPGGVYKAPAMPAVVATWTGGYIGIFGGGHWSRDRWISDEGAAEPRGAFNMDVDGANVGGLIGANLQLGRAVWGIEADGGWMSGSSRLVGGPAFPADFESLETKARWNAHGRLRFGYAVGNWLPFVAGGVAYASTRTTEVDSTEVLPSQSIALNRLGFTFGGGVDWKFASTWIGRLEYLHDRYGTASYGSAVVGHSNHFELTSHIVRGALMYQFGGGPVVARY